MVGEWLANGLLLVGKRSGRRNRVAAVAMGQCRLEHGQPSIELLRGVCRLLHGLPHIAHARGLVKSTIAAHWFASKWVGYSLANGWLLYRSRSPLPLLLLRKT